MSKVVRLMVALTIALFAAQVAVAKPSSKPTKTVSSKPVKATQLKSTSPKSTTTKVSKPSKPTKTTTTKASKPTKTTTSAKTTKTEKAMKPAKTTKSSSAELAQTTKTKGKSTTTASTSTTSTSTGTTTTSGGTTTTTTEHIGPEMNSKLSKKLTEDSKFTLRMQDRLNLPGDLTVQDAAAGFKNWGQFNAAVNMSERLGIPFNDLKAALTGWTLPNTTTLDATPATGGIMSLGQAQKAFRDGTLPTYPAPDATPTTTTSTSTKTTSGTK